jgi:deazaflavin-dependent oxidoreductase (nitroreductase family)
MLRFSRLPAALLRAGVPLGPLYLLETKGWRSGLWRTVPVVVLQDGGHRWLVSVFGETGWVANVRVTGGGRLRRGRRAETIQVTEVTDPRRAEVAMHLRRAFRIVPFVRRAFKATPRDGIEAFQAEAHHHPTFLVHDG